MDVATITLFISMVITMTCFGLGAYCGGIYGGLIFGTIAILGFSLIPTIPMIPIWVAVLVILLEIILIAYKVAQAFGIGQGGGAAQ